MCLLQRRNGNALKLGWLVACVQIALISPLKFLSVGHEFIKSHALSLILSGSCTRVPILSLTPNGEKKWNNTLKLLDVRQYNSGVCREALKQWSLLVLAE